MTGEVPAEHAPPRIGAETGVADSTRADIPTEEGTLDSLISTVVDLADRATAPLAESELPRAARETRWAQSLGQVVIRIDDLVLSPFRARLPPDPDSLRLLADSIASGVQPIPPAFVRRKDNRWELLGGHRIILAGQRYLGWTELLAVVLDIPDDVEAAYWVIGSNYAHEKPSQWVLMRAVRILLAVSPGDEVTTQREIARRNGWRESAVSEAKYWASSITPAVIKKAGVDEAAHSASLNRLTRDQMRDIRCGATDEERAAILRRLVLGPREGSETAGGLSEATEDLFSTTMVGNTWRVEVADLPERSDSELRAICRRMVQHLKAEHRALRIRS